MNVAHNDRLLVKVFNFQYKGKPRMGVKFPVNERFKQYLKQHFGSDFLWSATYVCFHLPLEKEVEKKLRELITGRVNADFSELCYPAEENPFKEEKPLEVEGGELEFARTTALRNFEQYMVYKRYSKNTQNTYLETLRTFLYYFTWKHPAEITNDDFIIFNNEYIIKSKFSFSYQNQFVNAIKLYYGSVANKKMVVEYLKRPKTEKKLPHVLSKEDVKQIIYCVGNIKHRAMLSLIYGCGLRRSELLNLKPVHVDSKRKVLVIKQAKGRKDRIAPLSEKIIELLRDYYKAYKPVHWLFEGQVKGEPYSEQSLQRVFKDAVKRSKIANQSASLHWLRHSFATHVLESGVDLRYIQEILGHKSSKTTEIYTHVSTKSIQNVRSPFDDL